MHSSIINNINNNKVTYINLLDCFTHPCRLFVVSPDVALEPDFLHYVRLNSFNEDTLTYSTELVEGLSVRCGAVAAQGPRGPSGGPGPQQTMCEWRPPRLEDNRTLLYCQLYSG